MNPERLQTPVTEIEIARLLNAENGGEAVLTEAGRDIVRRMAFQLQTNDRMCAWTDNKDPDYPGWETSCGHEFCLVEGGPKENSYNYCPQCGGKINLNTKGKSDE